MSKGKRQRKQSDLDRLTEDKKIRAYAGLIIVLVGLFAVTMMNSAFAGGWEITSSFESVSLNGTNTQETGKHDVVLDVDLSFNDAVEAADSYQGLYPSSFDMPGVACKSAYPYYLTLVGGDWVKTENPAPLDEYKVDLSEDSFQTYKQWVIGIDVSYETTAEKYYLPIASYGIGYGWSYEYKTVSIVGLTDVSITPWTPFGSIGNFSVTGGWSGIMSASIAAVSFGLVEEGATENYGHTIQGIMSKGQAVNMYGGEPVDFHSTAQLAGIPTSVDLETRAQLGAGAQYTTDLAGHWDSLAVRNVFVKYTLRVDILTTLVYKLQLGHQDELEDPDEDNTAYQPEITPFKNFFDNLISFFSSPFAQIFMLVIVLIGGGIVCIVLRKD